MKTVARLLVSLVVALGLVVGPGCGQKKPDVPKTYPVSVKIVHRGQPVEGANVVLVPKDASGKGASGVTDASGLAKMGLPGLAEGAVPGKYQVSVSKVKGTASEPGQASGNPSAAPSAPEHLLPVKYLSAASSGLECTVTDQPDQVIELKLD